MSNKFAIGVDIGGSHVSSAAVNVLTGKIFNNSFADSFLDNHAEPVVITSIWGETIKRSIETVGFRNIVGIGLAMPGPFDYENGISLFDGNTKKYEKTYGVNFSDAIKDYLKLPKNTPVRFINDAAAFAIGEAWTGKASGYSRSLSITIGTGLGSGFINDGVPVFNGDFVPKDGFIWHLPYQGSVADEHFSTRGLVKKYFELTGRMAGGVKEIAGKATSEPGVKKIFEEFGWNLSQLLAPWIKRFDAETLIVGGNISNAFPIFGPSMKRSLHEEGVKIPVEKSELNDQAAIIGSAKLIDGYYWQRVLPIIIQ